MFDQIGSRRKLVVNSTHCATRQHENIDPTRRNATIYVN